MRTAPCPNCDREVMRDGAPGLLVCTCGQVLEFVTDLEGELNPAPDDKRWFGTYGEREDMAELGIPEPRIPSRKVILEDLERRVEEQRTAEAKDEERRAQTRAAYARLSARFERDEDDAESDG